MSEFSANKETVQGKMENIWSRTCGTWENCNEETIESFLLECEKQSIDPQFCLSWLTANSNKIPNFDGISEVANDWVVEHTSTGSPVGGIQS